MPSTNLHPKVERKARHNSIHPASAKKIDCRRFRPRRSRKGVSLIETLAGMMVLIPLGLVALDLSTLIATQNIQERVVEDAARAAGNQVDQNSASQAAKNSIDSFKPQSLILSITMENCNYNSASGQVAVTTVMNVKLPIPCGDFNIITLRADSLEPIVAMPAPL